MPGGYVGGCLRVVGDGRWREVSRGVGDAAPAVCPGKGGSEALSSGCGPPSPPGEGKKGLLLATAQASAGGVEDAAPTVAGNGRQRKVAAGVGHPALRTWGYGNAVGFT